MPLRHRWILDDLCKLIGVPLCRKGLAGAEERAIRSSDITSSRSESLASSLSQPSESSADCYAYVVVAPIVNVAETAVQELIQAEPSSKHCKEAAVLVRHRHPAHWTGFWTEDNQLEAVCCSDWWTCKKADAISLTSYVPKTHAKVHGRDNTTPAPTTTTTTTTSVSTRLRQHASITHQPARRLLAPAPIAATPT
ncbi:hypothetical protein DOTSEDRAFT_30277 [Dothistroma septosporum NZE10]|uniref:Uncharacterized protein n=1 Tax=Dothistroma septosporum (strain NZE10 / CBS 128990) TaxID=675120 RepID=N1Q369_DOTSN|nr:hypothetical protein DOTSEDRAFT_30277 [Dothistroma septosporum NZE10]